MEKIRIGNDISLSVDVRQYLNKHKLLERRVYHPWDDNFFNIDSDQHVNKKYELYYPNQFEHPDGRPMMFRPEGSPVSIRSVEAVLINTTRANEIEEMRKKKEREDKIRKFFMEKERARMHREWECKMDRYRHDLKRHSRFIARFPIEPAMECFEPTPFDICCSGYPSYRAYPRHYLFAPYHGFGVYPRWHDIYRPICPMPPHPHMDPSFADPVNVVEEDSIEIIDDSKYTATVAATDKQSVVEVLFPAKDQEHIGKYSMILTIKAYVPGYTDENLKTITIDIPDVFEIVATSEEAKHDSTVRVHVHPIEDHLSMGEEQVDRPHIDVFVNEGSVNDDTMTLGRTDGEQVEVDLSPVVGWGDPDRD